MRPLIAVLLIFLWLVSFSDGVAACLAARQSFRIRRMTEDRWVFEMFTAFGIGLTFYAFETFTQVFLSIVFGPTAVILGFPYLPSTLINRLVRTLGMWLVAITLLNGGAPSLFRTFVLWISSWFGVMDKPPADKRPGIPEQPK